MGLRIATILFVLGAALALPRTARAGYTHSWTWRARPDATALARCVGDMKKLAEARREILIDGEGRSGQAAQFQSTCAYGDAGSTPCVIWNGVGDDGHEHFAFPLAAFAGTPEYSFVKTAQKPYDTVVVAALLVARDHFPQSVLEISSDGTWNVEWSAGAALYESVMKRTARNPMGPSGERLREAPPPLRDAPRTFTWSTRRKVFAVVIGVLLLLTYAVVRRG
jgi:hypothetical protein